MDTRFYCCDQMKDRMSDLGEYYYAYLHIKFCPFCGTRMSRNYGWRE